MTEVKRLFRDRNSRVVAGVCGGLGQYFRIDPVIIRLVWVLAVLMGGTGILAYLICWIVIPYEPFYVGAEVTPNASRVSDV